ncbi:MAG: ammonium transporter [Leptolyngbyaceae cyanobacterium]
MNTALDEFWMIASACLVFLMQAGFLCLEAGATRRKNNINVAIKNMADLGLSLLIFWLVGYGLMFGTSVQGWLGTTQFVPELAEADSGFTVFFIFQAMFCSTAVTILSGAIAERMNFKSYLLIAIMISGVVYPIFGHWAWNGLNQSVASGWLMQQGFVDFAGSTVVHSLGGWAALATALFIGPRMGRFSQKRLYQHYPSSDIPLSFLGALLLWFGWLGFNGGSTLGFNDQVPGVLANTLLAGAAGLVTPLLYLLFKHQEVSTSLVMNGALAGLVAITANCHAVSSPSAIAIGAGGGLVMLLSSTLLERCRIDDVVGAIPVHLAAGIWGTLAVAIFGDLDRLGTNLDRLAQLQAQVSGILACGIWTFTVALALLAVVNRWLPLRVSRKQEYMGLNIAEHGAPSELQNLYNTMKLHVRTGELQHRVSANSFTEIGQISSWYNQVVQSLEQVIARLDGIITTAVDGIVTIDPDTLRVQSTNPAIETLFGYSWRSIVGQSLTVLIGTDHGLDERAAGKALRGLLVKSCCSKAEVEALGFHLHGRRFPVEVVATKSRKGSQVFWTVMIRDITTRKATEAALQASELAARQNAEQLKVAIAQLKQTQTQMLQAEKMVSLGQLVAGVAHEINNPVGFIHCNLSHAHQYINDLIQVLDYYQKHCPPLPATVQAEIDDLDVEFLQEDFSQLLGSMQVGTNRIRDIVKSLKNFARHDEANLKRVDIHEGLDSTLTILSHQLKATADRPAITIEKYYGDLPKVECYAGALNQVFLNILNNAVEAIDLEAIKAKTHPETISVKATVAGAIAPSPTSGENHGKDHGKNRIITITTEAIADTISITIQDNGPGIAQTVQQKIFDPFFTTKAVGQGTGMGLAISHQIIVEKHGGQLRCQSVPGEGTEFVITLPSGANKVHA